MTTVLVIAISWIILTSGTHLFVRPWLTRHGGGNTVFGILRVIDIFYAGIWHRLKTDGRHHIPAQRPSGGMIVVSNHTGALDPILIQNSIHWVVHWMMASEMILPALDAFWHDSIPVIGVDRDGKDLGPAREAIRRVRQGHSLGIFPEGRIVTPPERIWPFQPGVGLIIAKTRAPVLLAFVRGTPPTTNMFGSLFRPSRAKVTFLDYIEYPESMNARAITEDLRNRLIEHSGWPEAEPPPLEPDPTNR